MFSVLKRKVFWNPSFILLTLQEALNILNVFLIISQTSCKTCPGLFILLTDAAEQKKKKKKKKITMADHQFQRCMWAVEDHKTLEQHAIRLLQANPAIMLNIYPCNH